MPHSVKLLIAGDPPPPQAEKGDVVEVVRSTSDWGAKTVAPTWIRLTVTGVTSGPDTQEAAEEKARGWLNAWQAGFTYAKVTGAGAGRQRYRIEAAPEIANDLDQAVKLQVRDALVSVVPNGLVAGQGTNFVEIDGDEPNPPAVEDPIAEGEFMRVVSTLAYRRFFFPASLVDTALAGATAGQPLEFTRTQSQANSLVVDRLKT